MTIFFAVYRTVNVIALSETKTYKNVYKYSALFKNTRVSLSMSALSNEQFLPKEAFTGSRVPL